ncbi:MAG: TIGR00296 family protein [Methanoregula sp.]|jgi:uncharacterized protein (TIGR00296 family)
MQLLTSDEGLLAVRLARGAILYAIERKPKPMITLTPVFKEKRGVFVTLTKDGELRGCIGFPYPVLPLGDAIENAAVAAALEDPRFPGVKKAEVETLDFEVTVLTTPVPLDCDPADRPAHIEVGRHGLIARGYGTSGLLLPQVATEYNWDAKTFLSKTCEKAGLPSNCWQQPIIEILTFEGQIFTGSFKGSV